MIRIIRGLEPETLRRVRDVQFARLRVLAHSPRSKDIDGYRVVSSDLWRVQHYKCCYCERFIPESFNDVEHYRPKGSAARLPGCAQTHGYWWLSFEWSNLLFACPGCNRSNKNDLFPLKAGSKSLVAQESPPGGESPLLIDPAGGINPVLHLEFFPLKSKHAVDWWVRGRDGSEIGQATVQALKMNAMEYRELRSHYFKTYIAPAIFQLSSSLGSRNPERIRDAHIRAMSLISPGASYVALASDALRHYVPDNDLMDAGAPLWPALATVGTI